MDTEFNVYKPKYQYNKALCAETAYANSYVTMSGVSPYAAKRPAGGQEQRKWIIFSFSMAQLDDCNQIFANHYLV